MSANDFVEANKINHSALNRNMIDQFVGLTGLMPSISTGEKPMQSTAQGAA